jgi:hypothetical protein
MNNGRYLQIMDVARAEWMVRSGVVRSMRRRRWGALLGGGTTRFSRSLKLWQRYQVRTRVLYWDSRWFYIEHLFTDDAGRKVAVGVSRAALRHTSGWVHTADVVETIAPGATSPPAPNYLAHWKRLDGEMFAYAEPGNYQDSLLTEASP